MSAIAEAEFEVEGVRYRASRLSVFDQQTVASKISGIILLMNSNVPVDAPPRSPNDFVRAFCALAGDMRKSDSDLILGLCMSIVTRDQGADRGFAPIRRGEGVDLFQDINLKEMLLIVYNVLIQHRIPDFFADPRSS